MFWCSVATRIDVAAAAAIAAAGSAARDVLLAAKGQAAVAAVAGLHQDSCFIDEYMGELDGVLGAGL